jgi:hypothetical protein
LLTPARSPPASSARPASNLCRGTPDDLGSEFRVSSAWFRPKPSTTCACTLRSGVCSELGVARGGRSASEPTWGPRSAFRELEICSRAHRGHAMWFFFREELARGVTLGHCRPVERSNASVKRRSRVRWRRCDAWRSARRQALRMGSAPWPPPAGKAPDA